MKRSTALGQKGWTLPAFLTLAEIEPDEVREEVLARLLELNAEHAKEEARSGAAAAKKRGKKATKKRRHKTPKTGDLFS